MDSFQENLIIVLEQNSSNIKYQPLCSSPAAEACLAVTLGREATRLKREQQLFRECWPRVTSRLCLWWQSKHTTPRIPALLPPLDYCHCQGGAFLPSCHCHLRAVEFCLRGQETLSQLQWESSPDSVDCFTLGASLDTRPQKLFKQLLK